MSYLDNLTVDGLIAHLEAMKAAGVDGGAVLRVNVYTAPTLLAEDRPDFPRAQYTNGGRIIATEQPRADDAVLSIIQDGDDA